MGTESIEITAAKHVCPHCGLAFFCGNCDVVSVDTRLYLRRALNAIVNGAYLYAGEVLREALRDGSD